MKSKCKKDDGSKEALLSRRSALASAGHLDQSQTPAASGAGRQAPHSNMVCFAQLHGRGVNKTLGEVPGTHHLLVPERTDCSGVESRLSWRLRSVGVRGGSKEPGGKISLGIDPINIFCCFGKCGGIPARAYPRLLCALGWVQRIGIGCFYDFCLGKDSAHCAFSYCKIFSESLAPPQHNSPK